MTLINNQLLFNILIFGSIFILSVIFTYIYLRIATKLNLSSTPHKGGVRQDITPTSGGLAFALLYFIIFLLYDIYYAIPYSYKYSILFGSGLITLIGFLDDLYGLSSLFRLIIQFILLFTIGYFFDIHIWILNDDGYSNLLISFLFLFGSIWLINTFNFIDGADGLVATNSAIFSLVSGLFFFLINENILSTCLWFLCAINLGFLVFNWSPAKIFMGDSGSLFLGSIFVVFIIGSSFSAQIPIWTWLTLLSIFYMETTITLFVRLWRRENAFKETHSLHAYQRLIINTGKHYKPAFYSIWINALWTVPLSFLCFSRPQYGMMITLLSWLPLAIIFYVFGPYQTRKNIT